MSDWAPLLDTSDVNHALLLPILLHCRDDQGRRSSRTRDPGRPAVTAPARPRPNAARYGHGPESIRWSTCPILLGIANGSALFLPPQGQRLSQAGRYQQVSCTRSAASAWLSVSSRATIRIPSGVDRTVLLERLPLAPPVPPLYFVCFIYFSSTSGDRCAAPGTPRTATPPPRHRAAI
jgi:hypothetical protein